MGDRSVYREAHEVAHFRGSVMVAEGQIETPCELAFEEQAVTAVVDDRVVAWIPLVDLQLEAGGYDGDFLFARGATGYPSIATRDRAFEKALRARAQAGPPSLRAALERLEAGRREQKSWRGFGVNLIASIFGLG